MNETFLNTLKKCNNKRKITFIRQRVYVGKTMRLPKKKVPKTSYKQYKPSFLYNFI